MATEIESTPKHGSSAPQPRSKSIAVAEVFLRILMSILLVVALMLVTTSTQTKTFPVTIPGVPVPVSVTAKAKYRYMPAVIYFVVAVSVAIIYSVITTLVSLSTLIKFKPRFTSKLAIYVVILDVLFLAIIATAGGSAAGVSYIGFKGNKHVGWQKLCNLYTRFCWKAGIGVGIGLLAAAVQVLLISLYVIAQYKRIPNKVHYHQSG